MDRTADAVAGSPSVASTIVIGVDGSAGSRAALRWGLREAERRRVPVLIAHTFGPSLRDLHLGRGQDGPTDLRRFHEGAERARTLLGRAGQQARASFPLLDIETVAINERPSLGLVEVSRRADLLVVGTHGAGSFAAVLVGSTVMSVASRSYCTVVAVPAPTGDAATRRGVVVGVDLRTESDAVLDRAFAEAHRHREPLTALHAWCETAAGGGPTLVTNRLDVSNEIAVRQAALASVLAPWQERYPDLDVRHHVVAGHPPRALAAAAHHARLLVVGCRSTGRGQTRPLGTVSHAVLHLTGCPVAVVHPTVDLSEVAPRVGVS
jgi:nucleotide-binding universal stress UspA family protein